MYPGLFKPIMLTPSRYNQHTGKYANIIEVGATGNTLEQCLTSMKYLSAVMNEVLKQRDQGATTPNPSKFYKKVLTKKSHKHIIQLHMNNYSYNQMKNGGKYGRKFCRMQYIA